MTDDDRTLYLRLLALREAGGLIEDIGTEFGLTPDEVREILAAGASTGSREEPS